MTRGQWQPGQSGNPKGRPKKRRALTRILERAGSQTLEVDGKRVSGKRLVARLLWDIAKEGQAKLPGGRLLMVEDFADWLDVVKFLYSHIDGPPKAEVGVEHSGDLFINLIWGDRDDIDDIPPETA